MELEIKRFYKACNPSKTLNIANPYDRNHYIDFSNVRGRNPIIQLERTITLLSPDESTCQLFTGHIGCGKSTELLHLKANLEAKGFHVIYFESTEDLEMEDVDISDILLAIIRRISLDLEKQGIDLKSNYFTNLLKNISSILLEPISLDSSNFTLGIGKITAQSKHSPNLRLQLRQLLEPRTSSLIEALNHEIINPSITKLKKKGFKGLVIIVDNLDRLSTKNTFFGRSQPEYLFVDRGEQLRSLNCHIIYTIPLMLLFSSSLGNLTNRFGLDPIVLPMVPVYLRDGTIYKPGLNLLQKMVLARAFPMAPLDDRVKHVTKIFENEHTFDRLCLASGGHIRNLLMLLSECIIREDPPFSDRCLESVIRMRQNALALAITNDEWQLLKRVHNNKSVRGEEDYRILIRSLFVFEYREAEESWFDVNPLLLNQLCKLL